MGDTKQVPYRGGDSQKLGAIVQNLFAMATWDPKFVPPALRYMYANKPYNHNLNTSYRSIYQTTMLVLTPWRSHSKTTRSLKLFVNEQHGKCLMHLRLK